MRLRAIFLSVLLGLGLAQPARGEPWNDFIDKYGRLPLDAVDRDYRGEYLAFWYFNEVYNGGHLQYFLNKDDYPWEETANAMEAMGAAEHATIMRQAISRWRGTRRVAPRTVEEYVAIERQGEFNDLDNAMYDLKPELEYYVYRSLVRKAD